MICISSLVSLGRLYREFTFHNGGVVRGGNGLRVGEVAVRISPPSCRAIQQSDEMHCPMCALRWDVNDPEPPKCRAAR